MWLNDETGKLELTDEDLGLVLNSDGVNPFQMVVQMQQHFQAVYRGSPRLLPPDEKEFRLAAFREEVQEYEDAVTQEEHFDALIDLIVFALGAIARHGFWRFGEGFVRVMRANFAKEVGTNQKRGSFKLDLIKPPGWEAPDLSDLVDEETD